MRPASPKILALYAKRAVARGLTLEQWYEVTEREHIEAQERNALLTQRPLQIAALARRVVRSGRAWRWMGAE